MKEKENLEKGEMTKENVSTDNSETQENDIVSEENNSESSTGELSNEITQEEKLQEELAEMKEKYLRLYSEFENYRRRTAKERLDLIKTASEDVLKDLIPVVDDFERALKAEESLEVNERIKDGNFLIYSKLIKILTSKGLKPMEDLIGKNFDADTQEAITQISAPNEEMKGKVIDVVEKGYMLGDKVVRYAKVVIGN